jgi:tRNA-splicing ligase RtcB
VLAAPKAAAAVLNDLREIVPARRRNRRAIISQPGDLAGEALSHPGLESVRRNEGATEFATLGSGNHFIEFQADEDDRLWLMVHSGSRAIGQAIREHYLALAEPAGNRLRSLDAGSDAGSGYLHDASYARRFADASRRAIAELVGKVVATRLGGNLCWETAISTDHNHVALEQHDGSDLFVHRKGAMPARLGESGVMPGSMGARSFHVEGRGHVDSLCSSAHGAGRLLSRTEARCKVTEREFRRQMTGIWYDFRLGEQLRDEAPSVYKDIRAVLRAQRELVKVTRTLRPILSYKGV